MRTLLAVLFSPCVICLALIVGAFAIDGLGPYERVIGTILIAVALWGPELLVASGRAVRCPAPGGHALPTPEGREVEALRPWWRRGYTLGAPQLLLLGGFGGVAVGCIVSISLDGPGLRTLLTWGGGYGVLGLMATATVRLMDERNPHHEMFEAVVRHVSRFFFVILFALGFWQAFPPGLVVMLSGALVGLILFTSGAVFNLALMCRATVHSFRYRSG